MKYTLLIIGLLLTICSCKTGGTKPIYSGKKIEIVDPDYGILSETYRNRSGTRPLMWRCFPINIVEVRYRSWRAADGMGRYDVIVTMCDFEILVNSTPFQNIYSGRRAKQEVYCREFKNAWNNLTQGEEYICLDGETLTKGQPEKDEESMKMVTSWTWDKIKTKKGCYSFWDGYQCADF